MNKTLITFGWGAILVGNYIGFIQKDLSLAYQWSLAGSGVLGLGIMLERWRRK